MTAQGNQMTEGVTHDSFLSVVSTANPRPEEEAHGAFSGTTPDMWMPSLRPHAANERSYKRSVDQMLALECARGASVTRCAGSNAERLQDIFTYTAARGWRQKKRRKVNEMHSSFTPTFNTEEHVLDVGGPISESQDLEEAIAMKFKEACEAVRFISLANHARRAHVCAAENSEPRKKSSQIGRELDVNKARNRTREDEGRFLNNADLLINLCASQERVEADVGDPMIKPDTPAFHLPIAEEERPLAVATLRIQGKRTLRKVEVVHDDHTGSSNSTAVEHYGAGNFTDFWKWSTATENRSGEFGNEPGVATLESEAVDNANMCNKGEMWSARNDRQSCLGAQRLYICSVGNFHMNLQDLGAEVLVKMTMEKQDIAATNSLQGACKERSSEEEVQHPNRLQYASLKTKNKAPPSLEIQASDSNSPNTLSEAGTEIVTQPEEAHAGNSTGDLIEKQIVGYVAISNVPKIATNQSKLDVSGLSQTPLPQEQSIADAKVAQALLPSKDADISVSTIQQVIVHDRCADENLDISKSANERVNFSEGGQIQSGSSTRGEMNDSLARTRGSYQRTGIFFYAFLHSFSDRSRSRKDVMCSSRHDLESSSSGGDQNGYGEGLDRGADSSCSSALLKSTAALEPAISRTVAESVRTKIDEGLCAETIDFTKNDTNKIAVCPLHPGRDCGYGGDENGYGEGLDRGPASFSAVLGKTDKACEMALELHETTTSAIPAASTDMSHLVGDEARVITSGQRRSCGEPWDAGVSGQADIDRANSMFQSLISHRSSDTEAVSSRTKVGDAVCGKKTRVSASGLVHDATMELADPGCRTLGPHRSPDTETESSRTTVGDVVSGDETRLAMPVQEKAYTEPEHVAICGQAHVHVAHLIQVLNVEGATSVIEFDDDYAVCCEGTRGVRLGRGQAYVQTKQAVTTKEAGSHPAYSECKLLQSHEPLGTEAQSSGTKVDDAVCADETQLAVPGQAEKSNNPGHAAIGEKIDLRLADFECQILTTHRASDDEGKSSTIAVDDDDAVCGEGTRVVTSGRGQACAEAGHAATTESSRTETELYMIKISDHALCSEETREETHGQGEACCERGHPTTTTEQAEPHSKNPEFNALRSHQSSETGGDPSDSIVDDAVCGEGIATTEDEKGSIMAGHGLLAMASKAVGSEQVLDESALHGEWVSGRKLLELKDLQVPQVFNRKSHPSSGILDDSPPGAVTQIDDTMNSAMRDALLLVKSNLGTRHLVDLSLQRASSDGEGSVCAASADKEAPNASLKEDWKKARDKRSTMPKRILGRFLSDHGFSLPKWCQSTTETSMTNIGYPCVATTVKLEGQKGKTSLANFGVKQGSRLLIDLTKGDDTEDARLFKPSANRPRRFVSPMMKQ